MDYKIILGIAAIVVGFISYIPYFKDIFFGNTKPHMFSWFVWAVLEGIAFFAQVSKGGGAGAWVTGTTSIMCILVFIVALRWGEKNISLSDKLSLAGALLAIIFWVLNNNVLIAVVLVTVADFLGYVPTFRKSFYKPREETIKLYMMSILKLALSLFALKSFSFVTAFYPAALLLANTAFVLMVTIRRRILWKI